MGQIIIFVKKNWVWIALFLLVIPSFISLVRPGYFWMQDDLQAFRIQQLDKCVQDFQIPCRWVPDAGYQYGYPQFMFYPPSVYYVGEILHLIGFQFIDAVKILFVLGFIFSAVAMLVFLKSWLGEKAALVGSVLYTYTSYKAVDVYVRGAMSEFWSFVFFPLIFWSSMQLIKTGKTKYLVFMALSISGLLTTHNLMSMIFLPVAGCWMLMWVVLEKKWKVVLKLAGGGLLGLGLAAFFTLPVLFERQYVHVESMVGGYFDYRQHFVDVDQLFISNHWGYGSSYLGPGDDLSLSTGNILWISSLFSLVLVGLLIRKNKKLAVIAFGLAAIDLFVLFLNHQKSTFIWDRIEVLTWLQFPWRLLANSIFILSILSSISIYLIGKKRVGDILAIVLIVSAFVLYGNFFKPMEWYNISDQDKFSGKYWEKELTISIFDYLPIYATLPPINKAPEKPEVLEGKAQILEYKKGSDYQKGRLLVEEKALLRLPLYDFPGMEVKVDGKKVIYWHDDCRGQEFCLGLITFNVGAGEHIIETRLGNTPVRAVSNALTVVSLLILGTLIAVSLKHESKKSS